MSHPSRSRMPEPHPPTNRDHRPRMPRNPPADTRTATIRTNCSINRQKSVDTRKARIYGLFLFLRVFAPLENNLIEIILPLYPTRYFGIAEVTKHRFIVDEINAKQR